MYQCQTYINDILFKDRLLMDDELSNGGKHQELLSQVRSFRHWPYLLIIIE